MSLEKSKSIEASLQTIVLEEPPPEASKKTANLSYCAQLKLILTNITVEPILFCYVLPSVMASIATQNLSLEKSCRVNLALGDEICDALIQKNWTDRPDYKIHEGNVQKLVTNMAIWKNIIQSVLPSVLLLFLGSWSDRHKRRKPCILGPILGDIMTSVGFLICTFFFFQLPMEVNVFVEAVPPALFGGWFSMFMGVFSYISGISSLETRTLRIGAVNMFLNVSICIGTALSGILYEKVGYYGVYSLALVLYFTGFFYGTFCVKESSVVEENDGQKTNMEMSEEKQENKKGFFLDFFDIRHTIDTIKVAFKSGERNRRLRVLSIMVLVMIIIGPMHGEMNVFYYFVQYKFEWDAIDYSIFSTFQFVSHTFGTLFSLIFFTKFLKVDDAVLGMISSISKILGSLVYAFAPTPTIFYIGPLVEILNGTSFIAMRSIVSKLVPIEELGKINSLFGVCEAIVPLVYGPLYNITYNMTMTYFPGAFFIVGGALTFPAVVIFFWLYLEHRRDLAEDAKNKKQQEKLLKPTT